MKAPYLLVFSMLLAAQCAFAQTSPAQPKSATAAKPFCLFAGSPPSNYPFTVLQKVKVGKGTYGSVNDVIPPLVDEARSMGGDAIMNYMGSQRFGFWPWRFVRPVVRGTAIKWNAAQPSDCSAVGGSVAIGS